MVEVAVVAQTVTREIQHKLQAGWLGGGGAGGKKCLLVQQIEVAVVEVQEVITDAGSTGGSGVIVIRYAKDQAL